ncbi:hypothetical protein LRS03_00805 [Rhizobacter sp. J219]|jgi:ElaB/YqjD/DUF883 family membrane-anchored ribosome-binding protein|uniref:hypothetical protein n=1 Tax=Rhizobacter sp. J219 TaxID=2898430 RepID=UPI0021517FC1|nr:hypothetical protein [Rhizobacter sp. J219]MCR5881482.1 hypothetical protein [Rhizobacter sp. J219]
MYTKNPSDLTATPSTMADQAAGKADQAIRSTQRVAHDALDGLSDSVNSATGRVSPLIDKATEQATAFAQRSMDAVRQTSQQLRDKAMHASDTTASYIRNDPIKSVLIAAATGAALMALVSLLSRSRHHE